MAHELLVGVLKLLKALSESSDWSASSTTGKDLSALFKWDLFDLVFKLGNLILQLWNLRIFLFQFILELFHLL